jgi:DDE superfamily endonuclease
VNKMAKDYHPIQPIRVGIDGFCGGNQPWQEDVTLHFLFFLHQRTAKRWNLCGVPPLLGLAWPIAHALSCVLAMAFRSPTPLAGSASPADWSTSGSIASTTKASKGCGINPVPDGNLFFPPEVAVHLVKLACERPDDRDRSLSTWFCSELARQLVADGVVDSISATTVQRILASHKLKPWRTHMWLSPKAPRDAEFYERVKEIIALYTRPLGDHEVVLSVDEKTSLQPRTRSHATKPPLPGNIPNHVEHEYQRCGALQLFAAFDTHSGKVYGDTFDRKRQKEYITFLENLDAEIPPTVTTVHLVLDNVSTHHGKKSASLASGAFAICPPLYASSFLVDESGRAVVQHSAAQAVPHRRLQEQGGPRGQNSPVHRRME